MARFSLSVQDFLIGRPRVRKAREYECEWCESTVCICTRCDRGQRYCPGDCAEAARRESLRCAGKKYQSSETGRLKHAARQQRYLERQEEKMTHQGPPQMGGCVMSKLWVSLKARYRALMPPRGFVWCEFCGTACVVDTRRGFLGRPHLDVRELRENGPPEPSWS